MVRTFLQIPGPTNIPDRIQKAMFRPMINHRGLEFRDLLKQCVVGLQDLVRTSGDILLSLALEVERLNRRWSIY